MRKVLLVLVAALALAPAAAAKNPHDQTEPSPSVPTIVAAPTRVAPSDVSGGPTAIAAAGTAAPASSGCGACLTQCWGAVARSGPSDWSGHVYIYQHIDWCGNGSQVTSASVWQTYEQSGWYQLQSAYGPWYSGGCAGCASLSASGYILWNWTMQLTGIQHSGTTSLTTTVYAYGGVSAS